MSKYDLCFCACRRHSPAVSFSSSGGDRIHHHSVQFHVQLELRGRNEQTPDSHHRHPGNQRVSRAAATYVAPFVGPFVGRALFLTEDVFVSQRSGFRAPLLRSQDLRLPGPRPQGRRGQHPQTARNGRHKEQ